MTEDVTLALSELRALIIKAARGAGLSWGMAEEAGWAAEWLARRGLPAADGATLWLDARLRGGQDPVETGVALADQLAAAAALTCAAAISCTSAMRRSRRSRQVCAQSKEFAV